MDLVNTYDVAVIGGGVSGCAVMLALAQRVGPSYRAVLFDPAEPGRGIAYGDQSEILLMNGPARAMSVVPGDEEHLVRSLRNTAPDTMISRKRYGQYVSATLHEAIAGRRHFKTERTTIVDIEVREDTYLLHDANGSRCRARNVVFALGNAAPGDAFLPQAIRSHARYVGNPWKFDLDAIDGNVAIVGSRLTAFDVIALLDERGFAGRIHMISRHGAVPALEDPRISGTDPATFGFKTHSAHALLRSVRAAVAQHAASDDWRAIIESLRAVIPSIWASWDTRERLRFLRHVQSFWAIFRYRVPLETYAAYERLRERGAIDIVRGRITSAKPLAGSSLRITVARGSVEMDVEATTIINATGPNGDYATIDQPLVRNGLRRGVIRADRLSMGLDAGADLRLIGSGGAAQRGLFTLGPPLRGLLYESTAVPEILRQAVQIGDTLASMEARVELGAVS